MVAKIVLVLKLRCACNTNPFHEPGDIGPAIFSFDEEIARRLCEEPREEGVVGEGRLDCEDWAPFELSLQQSLTKVFAEIFGSDSIPVNVNVKVTSMSKDEEREEMRYQSLLVLKARLSPSQSFETKH